MERNELADSCLWNECRDLDVAQDDDDVPIPDVDDELAIIPNPWPALETEEWGRMGWCWGPC